MEKYKEIKGDLIALAKQGNFDVIAHGCNCFCTMGAGIAPQMARAFGANKFLKEKEEFSGDINKLGTINYERFILSAEESPSKSFLFVVNAYTQYGFGSTEIPSKSTKPLDYEALTMCMRKMNHIFKGKHIGLPMIGAGLAGGVWHLIKLIIQEELRDCQVTVVIYDK